MSFDRLQGDAQNFNSHAYSLNRPTALVDLTGGFAQAVIPGSFCGPAAPACIGSLLLLTGVVILMTAPQNPPKELVEISLDSGVANKVLRTEEQTVRIRPNRRVGRAISNILDDQKKFANPPMEFKMGFKEDTVILRGEVFFYD